MFLHGVRMTRFCFAATGIVTMLLVGCADPAADTAFRTRVIRNANPDQVMSAATLMLQREFGRLQIVDPANGRIETGWAPFSTSSRSGTARDFYGGRSEMRHMASFRVSKTDAGSIARIRIDVQRQDTVRQAVVQPRGYRLSDAPGHQTAIDRDAATTAKQNTVWNFVRRDQKLELSLLHELQETLARATAEEKPAS
jgi:hypothetical protein